MLGYDLFRFVSAWHAGTLSHLIRPTHPASRQCACSRHSAGVHALVIGTHTVEILCLDGCPSTFFSPTVATAHGPVKLYAHMTVTIFFIPRRSGQDFI